MNQKYLIGVLIAVLCGILFFGLKSNNLASTNSVNWIINQPGLHFQRYGIAYTAPFIEEVEIKNNNATSLTIEIALSLKNLNDNRFKFIFALHNGKEKDQLLLGQWRSWIILMNGDDYPNKKRTKRLAVDTNLQETGTLFLTITTGDHGTFLYCNGKLVQSDNESLLKLPSNGKSRIIFGNSADCKYPWDGDIYGFALYKSTLSNRDVTQHFKRWSNVHNFTFAEENKPLVLYLFNEKSGEKVFDHSGDNHDLEIPKKLTILESKILTWKGFGFSKNYIQDVIINIAGFIPLGFVFLAILFGIGGTIGKHGVLLTVSLCFTLSLFIEIFQAWVPLRSSSMLDLISNTLGAFIGTKIYRFLKFESK